MANCYTTLDGIACTIITTAAYGESAFLCMDEMIETFRESNSSLLEGITADKADDSELYFGQFEALFTQW